MKSLRWLSSSGAFILIFTGIALLPRICIISVVGVVAMASLFNAIGATPAMEVTALQHILYGGFAFGIVFMATDLWQLRMLETVSGSYGFFIRSDGRRFIVIYCWLR